MYRIRSKTRKGFDFVTSVIMSVNNGLPVGVLLIQKIGDGCCSCLSRRRTVLYKSSVVILTYVSYMCFHLSRKPISVVKAQLYRNCSGLVPPPDVNTNATSNWCSWAPFNDGATASELLGQLDSVYLFTYAAFMFLSGYVAERVNLRYFLSLGMLLSGLFCYLFGIAKTFNIHLLWYFILVQFLSGIVQSSGWPGVVTVMSNWFGKSKRGLIFGLWNSHTSLGNILGALIAAEYVQTNWAYSFIMPGILMGIVGFVLFLFLVVSPADVGCQEESQTVVSRRQLPARRLTSHVANDSDYSSETDDTEIVIGEQEVQRRASRPATERDPLFTSRSNELEESAISFRDALKLPGVLEYSFCLFFAKLVSYTFLYWLPFYVNASTSLNAKVSADLATLFDLGGIVGAIAAGAISDASGMSATTCMGMLILATPMMLVYEHWSHISLTVNMILLVLVGILVNGPYALITTAVSAELGSSVSGDNAGPSSSSKALATVTAIIDGTGSIGAAVGPLLASFVQSYSWRSVFLMLMISNIMAMILLLRLFKAELQKLWRRRSRYRRIE